MKQVYVKPLLYVESFQLAEHIASGCAMNTGTYTANSSNPWTCSVTDAGGTNLFMDTQGTKCTGQLIDPDLPDIDEFVSDLLGGQCYNSVVSGPMFSS